MSKSPLKKCHFAKMLMAAGWLQAEIDEHNFEKLSPEVIDLILTDALIAETQGGFEDLNALMKNLAGVCHLFRNIIRQTGFCVKFRRQLHALNPLVKYRDPVILELQNLDPQLGHLVAWLGGDLFTCDRTATDLNVYRVKRQTDQKITMEHIRILHLTALFQISQLETVKGRLYAVDAIPTTARLYQVDPHNGQTTVVSLDFSPDKCLSLWPGILCLLVTEDGQLFQKKGNKSVICHPTLNHFFGGYNPLQPAVDEEADVLLRLASTWTKHAAFKDNDNCLVSIDDDGRVKVSTLGDSKAREINIGTIKLYGSEYRAWLDKNRGIIFTWNLDRGSLQVFSMLHSYARAKPTR